MSEIEGARTFQVGGDAYDSFMGRYSRRLAEPFGDYCLPGPGGRFLDVGCGPGALTAVAVARLGAEHVAAIDPAPGFVGACRERYPGVDVRVAPAENLPFEAAAFDAAAAQLVFHFVTDAARAVADMRRVVRPDGIVAAAVWDFADGMTMLRAFWDAAASLSADGIPNEANALRFGAPGEIATLFTDGGLVDIEEDTITVSASYTDADELWHSFLAGIGPAGAYAVAQPPAQQERLRAALTERIGNPPGSFELSAVARVARARVPAR